MNQNNELQQIQELVSNIFNNKYIIQKQLGQGSFSQVFQCIHNQSNQKYAMKIIRLQEFSDKIQDYMINELTILQKNFDNPNIIRLIDSYQTQDYLIIIMEYCIFDLEYLRQTYYDDKIPEDQVIIILRQIANGLHFLHKNQIIHRDLKLENIGIFLNKIDEKEQFNKSLFKDITFKLLDFGLSKILNDTHTNTFLGTPSNMAPEILNDQDYTLKVDIYSLGCCLFRMITGQFPYYDKKVSQLLKKIKQESASFENIQNPKLRQIVQNMLKENENERMDWETLYQTEFFDRKEEQLMTMTDVRHTINNQYYQQQSKLYKQSKLQQQSYLEIESIQEGQVNQPQSLIKNQLNQSYIMQNQREIEKQISRYLELFNLHLYLARAASQMFSCLTYIKSEVKNLSYPSIVSQFKPYIKYLIDFSQFIENNLKYLFEKDTNSSSYQQVIEQIQKQFFTQKLKDLKEQCENFVDFWSGWGSIYKYWSKFPKFYDFNNNVALSYIESIPENEIRQNTILYQEILRIIQDFGYKKLDKSNKEKIINIQYQLYVALIFLVKTRGCLEQKVTINEDSYYFEKKLQKNINKPDVQLDILQELLSEYDIQY